MHTFLAFLITLQILYVPSLRRVHDCVGQGEEVYTTPDNQV